MPCIANGCKRLQAKDNIYYISDQLLASAYHRFASKLSVPPRRHGSSVPGPLEASRRLARRKITAVSVPRSELAPAWSDWSILGAWTLSNNKTPTDTSWAWSPPTSVQPSSVDYPYYENAVRGASDLESLRQLYWSLCPTGPVATRLSKVMLDRLLSLVESNSTGRQKVEFDCFVDVLAFLRSDLNHVDAENMITVLRFMSRREPVSANVIRGIVDIIHERLDIDAMSTAERLAALQYLPILYPSQSAKSFHIALFAQLLPKLLEGEPTMSAAAIESVATFLPSKTTYKMLTAVLKSIRDKKSHVLHSEAITKHVMSALDVMGSSNAKRNARFVETEKALLSFLKWLPTRDSESGLWKMVVSQVTTETIASDAVTGGHACLTRWWKVLYKAGHLTRTEEQGAGYEVAFFTSIAQHGEADTRSVLVALGHTAKCTAEAQVEEYIRQALACQKLSVHLLLSQADIDLLTNLPWHPFRMYLAFKVWLDDGAKCPPSPALNLINHFLKVGHFELAKKIVQGIPELHITHRPNALLDLLDDTSQQRADGLVVLSLLHQPDTVDELTLVAEDLASRLAADESLSPRSAFRNVAQLYEFLKSVHADISPAISRALVCAGVTRYLATYGRLSTERFRFVLNVVREVEGERVAERIDRLAYVWRRRVEAEVDTRPVMSETEDATHWNYPATHTPKNAVQRKYAERLGVAEDEVGGLLPEDTALYTAIEPCNKRMNVSTESCSVAQKTMYSTVYVRVQEPLKFVGVNKGQQRLADAGIEIVHVTGLEEDILRVAQAGHEK